ncbi:MAG: PBP1A family penicillin-binding protein [Candidatus Marinimicrobia bacterium]|nr:PBP1A family penicillin-binding protein [Candidatus Neomarinimicrobiota bacterium]
MFKDLPPDHSVAWAEEMAKMGAKNEPEADSEPPPPPPPQRHWRAAFKQAFLLIVAGGVFLTGYLAFLARDLPSLRQLQDFSPATATKILSRDGKLISELFTQQRVLISLDKMPVDVRHAAISMEDRKFYDHWGVSMRSVARAIMVDLSTLSFSQGFSSLTQQLARTLYDQIGFRKTVKRKIKEILTAIQIERTYTKNEILEMYLNSVHFGHGTYGIQAAAREYYQKDARDLSLEESSTLIGVLPSPANYSPKRHPDRAFWRRNLVLRSMVGQGYIAEDEYERLRYKPMAVQEREPVPGYAPYFSEYVRRMMEKEDDQLGINLYRDGLSIHTTLDTRMQDIAERIFQEEIDRSQAVLNKAFLEDDSLIYSVIDTLLYPMDSLKMIIRGELRVPEDLRDRLLVQGAFILLENDTGNILAMIGGRGDYPDYFNRASQAQRQPGSTFKPMLYITAIDKGFPVSTLLLNQSLASTGHDLVDRQPGALVDTSVWNPQNDDGSSSGLVTMRIGLKRSLNIISARMIQELVTPVEVVKMAKRFQFTTPMRAVRAISLGTSEVIPLEITASYAAVANHGVWVDPIAVSRVVDRRGKTLREFIPERKEVIRADKAYLLLDLMRGVMNGGTGSRARWMYQFNRPAAGKTGTTDNWTDAWFIGFTPHLSGGVWFGVDDPRVSLGKNQYGNEVALPVWARIMREIHQTFDLPRSSWKMPDGLATMKICAVTKDRPTAYCPTEREIFLTGTEPPDTCEIHTSIDTETYDPDDDIFLN